MTFFMTPLPQSRAVGNGLAQAPYTALVYALDGVRFVAAAASRRSLMRRVATYVQRHAAERLWEGDARQVDTLLADSLYQEAVELYFALVGQRWDEEWIVVTDPAAS